MYLPLMIILLTWIDYQASVHSQRTAVAFVVRQIEPDVMSFAQSLADDGSNYNIDVYMLVDIRNTSVTSIRSISTIRIVDVSPSDTRQHGYQNMIIPRLSRNGVSAWDKAFFYFNVLHRDHAFLWLIEDDVFIASTRAFLALHSLYSGNSDLIVAENIENRVGNIDSWWWWYQAVGLFFPPWSHSMVNVVGLSRRTLDKVDELARWRGEAAFHEFFFNTLAIHENLTVRTPLEMDTLTWRYDHKYEEVVRRPNNLRHPVKDLRIHDSWRRRSVRFFSLFCSHHASHFLRLMNENSTTWHPLDFTTLLSLCRHHPAESTNREEEYMTRLVEQFDQMKSYYSPEQRLSIHRNVTDVFHRCRQQNTSVAILSILLRLADHAFRQPEGTSLL